ncbi:hypothetical protein BaRGS_00012978, partial [Batillaria attramentaria]
GIELILAVFLRVGHYSALFIAGLADLASVGNNMERDSIKRATCINTRTLTQDSPTADEMPVKKGQQDSANTLLQDLEDDEEVPRCDAGNTEIYTEQEEFLRVIHPKFLKIVQPFQSGLMDELRSVGAIVAEEEEEVKAFVTTTDKARALWTMLHRVPPKLFGEQCMPILRKLYRHMLEGAEYRWDGRPDLGSRCLRHVIVTRMTVKRFADIFPSTRCCSVEEYRKILDNRAVGDDQWEPVFSLLKANNDNTELIKKMQQILRDVGVDHTKNLKKQLSLGLPKGPRSAFFLVTTAFRQTIPSPQPPVGTKRNRFPAVERQKTQLLSRRQKKQPEPFRTREDRERYATILENINEALVNITNIRRQFRELERLRDQLIMMEESNKDASDERFHDDGTHFPSLDRRKYMILEGKAVNSRGELHMCYDRVKKALHDAMELQPSCSPLSDFPCSRVNSLLGRRHLLDNDFKEAEHFFEGAKKLYDEVTSMIREATSAFRTSLGSTSVHGEHGNQLLKGLHHVRKRRPSLEPRLYRSSDI